MTYPLDQYVPEVAKYSDALLSDVDGEGTIRNLKSFEATAMGMGASGNTELVLMTWAEILACTHADGESPLGPFVERIPDEQWQDPTRRHASALIDTAREVIGATDEFGRLTDQMYRASDTLGNDIWWLIMTMAQATSVVAATVGGSAGMAEVSRLARGRRVHDLAPRHALGPGIAALSAFAAGHPDAAEVYLRLCQPHELLGVLLPLADNAVATDVGDDTDPADVLTRVLLDAVHSGEPAQVAAAVNAVDAAEQHDRAQMIRHLALSIGSRIGSARQN